MTKHESAVPASIGQSSELDRFRISNFGLPSDFRPNMPRLLKLTVMLGGPSAEREVSLRSGAQVAAALRGLGHTVHELDPQQENWNLPEGTQVVFLALHGTYGEDGTVQRQLDGLGVPYTGCGAESSRIAFDKVLTKQLCVAAGVPTARFTVVDSPTERP